MYAQAPHALPSFSPQLSFPTLFTCSSTFSFGLPQICARIFTLILKVCGTKSSMEIGFCKLFLANKSLRVSRILTFSKCSIISHLLTNWPSDQIRLLTIFHLSEVRTARVIHWKSEVWQSQEQFCHISSHLVKKVNLSERDWSACMPLTKSWLMFWSWTDMFCLVLVRSFEDVNSDWNFSMRITFS